MINAIIYHIAYRIYDNPLITENGDIYFYAEDEDNFPFILVFDRYPLFPDDFCRPKAIRNPAIVIPDMIMALDAIDDDIHHIAVEIDGIKSLISEMALMPTADMYENVIAEEQQNIAEMTKRIDNLRGRSDHYRKWLKYLDHNRKIGE